jgi:hypothetical protein
LWSQKKTHQAAKKIIFFPILGGAHLPGSAPDIVVKLIYCVLFSCGTVALDEFFFVTTKKTTRASVSQLGVE